MIFLEEEMGRGSAKDLGRPSAPSEPWAGVLALNADPGGSGDSTRGGTTARSQAGSQYSVNMLELQV